MEDVAVFTMIFTYVKPGGAVCATRIECQGADNYGSRDIALARASHYVDMVRRGIMSDVTPIGIVVVTPSGMTCKTVIFGGHADKSSKYSNDEYVQISQIFHK